MNPRFQGFFWRDAFIGLLTIGVWLVPASGDGMEIARGVLLGLCALLLHEYGHLLGATLRGARVNPAPLWSPFLFDLDTRHSTRTQLLWSSYAGFMATALFLLLFWTCLPLERLAGRVAMGIGLFLATLTVVIEFPIAWRIARGYPVPRLEIFGR